MKNFVRALKPFFFRGKWFFIYKKAPVGPMLVVIF